MPEVERWVDAALPIGSSREQIETWLTEQGIEHSVSEIPVVECDGLHCRDVGKCLAVFGVIRNTDRSVLVNGSIQLTFFLEESGKLTERSVKWVGTGP
ncbi:MAG TPA: hypothetical protein VLM40_23820 [Gemmata sp.]|nr:hypothetical protein [Gemmata sp.]